MHGAVNSIREHAKCPARNSGMGLIFQNLVNIKGVSAGQDGILSKDKPAESGQIRTNP